MHTWLSLLVSLQLLWPLSVWCTFPNTLNALGVRPALLVSSGFPEPLLTGLSQLP